MGILQEVWGRLECRSGCDYPEIRTDQPVSALLAPNPCETLTSQREASPYWVVDDVSGGSDTEGAGPAGGIDSDEASLIDFAAQAGKQTIGVRRP
jgi:hypothetical protein